MFAHTWPHEASTRTKRARLKSENATSAPVTTVRTLLKGEENRFLLSHTAGPRVGTGAGLGSIPWNMSPLHQCEPGVDVVEDDRERQADGQVRTDEDQRDRDRRAGLVADDAGDDEQLGVARQDRERRVLREVQVLADHRRQDDAQRLREHDEAERLVA